MEGDPNIYPTVVSTLPTNTGGLAWWNTSNLSFWRTEYKWGGTFEHEVDDKGLSVVGVELVVVDFGHENLSFGLEGFVEMDNQERIGGGEGVQINELACTDEYLHFFGDDILAEEGAVFLYHFYNIYNMCE